MLVQMAGHGGSGKSTLARRIADRLGGVVVDLDTIKSALLDAGAEWEDASRQSYAAIYALVDDLLSTPNARVVVDTPSYWAEIHERLTSVADDHGAQYVFIECVADEAVRAVRLEHRPTRRSQLPSHTARPVDAPGGMTAPHLRSVQRPSGRSTIQVETDRYVDLDRLVAHLPISDQLD